MESKPPSRIESLVDIINNLTSNRDYAKVEIVIQAGSIEFVSVSKKYKFSAHEREQPGADNLVK